MLVRKTTLILLLFICIFCILSYHVGKNGQKRFQIKHRVGTKWSSQWPKVDLQNCSKIVYMNQGINEDNPLSRPRVGLVSFPGSGNTWVRYLVRVATGIWTGSIYADRQLFEGGFHAELDKCNDNASIVIKAHHPRQDITKKCPFDKIILIIRNPFGAILAEFNRRQTNSHVKHPPMSVYKDFAWANFIPQRAYKWKVSTEGWIENFATTGEKHIHSFTSDPHASGNLLLVSYERLKNNPEIEVRRIVQFLELPHYREHCMQNIEGTFKRKDKGINLGCLYSKSMTVPILEAIHHVRNVGRTKNISDISSEFLYDIDTC